MHVSTAGARVRDLTIVGNRVSANGQTNTAGYTQGIRIDAPTERFTIAGNSCWDPGPIVRQTHGIQLSAGATFVDGQVTGNHVTGNAIGGLNAAGTLQSCLVADNLG